MFNGVILSLLLYDYQEISSYSLFLLALHRVQQLYRIESLHPPAYSVTAARCLEHRKRDTLYLTTEQLTNSMKFKVFRGVKLSSWVNSYPRFRRIAVTISSGLSSQLES